jgi:hypothetical protein
MSFVVAIPSYQRPKVIQEKTLPLLLNAKVKPSDIYIFVANAEEKKLYEEVPKEMYGHLVVGKKGISYQRNFIIDYFPEGKHIVFIDDDISQIVRKRGSVVKGIDDLPTFFKQSFAKLVKIKKYLWTTKNQYNPFYKSQMKEEGEVGLVSFSGDLIGVINRKSMKIKLTLERGEAEQRELLFRYMEKDGGVLRFNNVVVISHKLTPGGKVAERGSVAKRKTDIVPNIQALAKAYPQYVSDIGQKREYRSRPTLEIKTDMSERIGNLGAGLSRVAENVNGSGLPPATVISEDEMTDGSIKTLDIRNRAKYNTARTNLLEALKQITVSKIPQPDKRPTITNRGDILGTDGRTMTFGFGDNRQGWNYYATNKKHPEVFKALVEFGNQVVPKGWEYQGITLNHGVKAKKHVDSKNAGKSVIIGIGDFTGGEIRVWDKDGNNPSNKNLHDKPVMFNGGILAHETQPFKGDRYTIIFYKQKRKPRSGKIGVGAGNIRGMRNPPQPQGIFA